MIFSIQYSFGQERITDFMYNDQGINALTRVLSELNGSLIFNAYTENYGDEMWAYNHQDSLFFLKDIFNGSSSSFPDYQSTGFTKYNNEMYFVANDNIHGYELWKTDGIQTELVHDIFVGEESSLPRYMTVFNGYLYFIAYKESHYHLCKSDGLNFEIVKDLGENSYGVAYSVLEMIASDNYLYFVLESSGLWISDGTEIGTNKIKDFSGIYYLTSIGGKVYFTGQVVFNGEKELYVSDGTENGTNMVVNIGGETSSIPFALTNFNGTLYFTAYTEEYGREGYPYKVGQNFEPYKNYKVI